MEAAEQLVGVDVTVLGGQLQNDICPRFQRPHEIEDRVLDPAVPIAVAGESRCNHPVWIAGRGTWRRVLRV